MSVLRLRKRGRDSSIPISRDDAARLGLRTAGSIIELDRETLERLRAAGKPIDVNPGDVEQLVVRRSPRTVELEPDSTDRSFDGDPNKQVKMTPEQLQHLLSNAPPASMAGTAAPRRRRPRTIDLTADEIQNLMATRDTTLDVELEDIEQIRVRKSAITIEVDTLTGEPFDPGWKQTGGDDGA